MSDNDLASYPPSGDMTLLLFFKKVAAELSTDSKLVLNHVMRSLMERGWLPSVAGLTGDLIELGEQEDVIKQSIRQLVHCRLLVLDDQGERFVRVMGSVSLSRTAHRVHLGSGVDLFTDGGMGLLAFGALFEQPLDGFTQCDTCQNPITFRVEDGALSSLNPHGIAGYQTAWDGVSSLEVLGQTSPLFCSDQCMNQWTESRSDLEGMPVCADFFLHMGMMMASELGQVRFEMVCMDD